MTEFINRKEAGVALAEKLKQYLEKNLKNTHKNDILIVGLPRGGVSVALEVARKFGSQLDILVSKKIPHPSCAEYAIGAVTSDGQIVLNPDIPESTDWQHYLEEQSQKLLCKTKESEGYFYDHAGYIPRIFENKIVIIVDDGIATGMTAIAAAETARHRGARLVIVAAPVISLESHHQISKFCQHVIGIHVTSDFETVGQFYLDFSQISDQEVLDAMKESHRFAPPGDMSFILQNH